MRLALVVMLVVLAPGMTAAKVLNVELKFTPYVGDPAKEDHVTSVAGKAAVFVNGVPYATQEIRAESVPVMFDEREVGPAVWVPVESMGTAVRRGKNTIRIEFEPSDPQRAYHARLGWTTVTDQETRGEGDGKVKATNTEAPGMKDEPAKGKVAMEHEIVADFAADVAWHHYPPVTSVSADDKQQLAALVTARVAAFKPDFKRFYVLLESDPRIQVAQIKKAKCVDAAYAAGVRIAAPATEQLEFVTTGGPEVVVRRPGGELFAPADPKAFDKIKGEEKQMCAGVALSVAFPPKLVVVHAPEGAWKVVY